MILVDAHVHIYDCFTIDLLLDSALSNFQEVAKAYAGGDSSLSYVLLLTEGPKESWFQSLSVKLAARQQSKITAQWSAKTGADENSLLVVHNDYPEHQIHIVAGHQVVTMENIEVLALFMTKDLREGLSLPATVAMIQQSGGISVLPWGVGKWLGKRGKIIKEFLLNHDHGHLFLGDNGGRPQFWPTPNNFHLAKKTGVAVLPGSDPLPLANEAVRVGSFGFLLQDHGLAAESPPAYLKKALLSSKLTISPFGSLQKSRLFFANQMRLRRLSAQ